MHFAKICRLLQVAYGPAVNSSIPFSGSSASNNSISRDVIKKQMLCDPNNDLMNPSSPLD
jgi:hypothetical protein